MRSFTLNKCCMNFNHLRARFCRTGTQSGKGTALHPARALPAPASGRNLSWLLSHVEPHCPLVPICPTAAALQLCLTPFSLPPLEEYQAYRPTSPLFLLHVSPSCCLMLSWLVAEGHQLSLQQPSLSNPPSTLATLGSICLASLIQCFSRFPALMLSWDPLGRY